MSKPLVIQLRETKAQLTGSINAAIRGGLPCYLLEPIIAELHTQVSNAANAEYEQAVKSLEAEKAKAENEEGGTDERRDSGSAD